MQEKQEVKEFNKLHCDYLIDYINKSHDYIDNVEAVSMMYIGKYELDSKGNVLYFPELFVRRKYRLHTSTPTRTIFKYEGRLNISTQAALYSCVIDFNIVNAIYSQCAEIIAKISTKKVEYNVFIDEKDGELSLHHAIRISEQLVIVLNEDYVLVNIYYTSDFFKPYKGKSLEESKKAVLFFALCAFNDRMSSVTKDVDIHTLTVEEMSQYITLVDMIEV
jgi:hypothetical protein